MDRCQILRAITRLNIGGPARQANLLTRALADDYPTLLATGRPPSGEGEMREPDVPVTYVPLVRKVAPVSDVRAVVSLRSLMRSTGARLVHTHMAKAGTAGRLAARTVRPHPITVHTFHGHVLEGYFTSSVQKAFIGMERHLARHTDALVAVSEEIRNDLLALGIGDEDRWHVIQLGFDLAPMLAVTEPSGALRAHIGLAEDVPLVGVLGRLAPIKEHVTLLEAMARLDGVHLAILGDGEMQDAIVARSDALGISARVHMIGWWLDVPAAIADLDVVALTSRNEGTPVSLIEAHACGKPAVSTNVGGVKAVVRDGISGSLVPAGDPVAVADALEAILSDRLLAARMGAEGRAHVRDRFTQERLVADIRNLYASLLE